MRREDETGTARQSADKAGTDGGRHTSGHEVIGKTKESTKISRRPPHTTQGRYSRNTLTRRQKQERNRVSARGGPGPGPRGSQEEHQSKRARGTRKRERQNKSAGARERAGPSVDLGLTEAP